MEEETVQTAWSKWLMDVELLIYCKQSKREVSLWLVFPAPVQDLLVPLSQQGEPGGGLAGPHSLLVSVHLEILIVV